ncbi:MAG: GNAT family N-acetyltransferase [Planctomycetota bacterium]|jgi:predicted GNAT superfamily acetyltransferase
MRLRELERVEAEAGAAGPWTCREPILVERLHSLNQRNLPAVGDIPLARMEHFARIAARFLVLEAGEGEEDLSVEPAGYLVALTPEADYDSPNFLWFRERWPEFLYVDRVAVADHARRRGGGRRLYEALFAEAREQGIPRVVCEVNLRPRNDVSLAFHASLGFRPVGEAESQGHRVQYLEKRIAPSDGA